MDLTIQVFVQSMITSTLIATAISSNQTTLSCYSCLYSNKEVFQVSNPCLNLVESQSQVYKQQCRSIDKYCKIERRRIQGIVTFLERSCTDTCLYGCRYRGLGLLEEICTTCCNRKSLCNFGNEAVILSLSSCYFTMSILIGFFCSYIAILM